MIDLWVARGDRIQASTTVSDQMCSLFDIETMTTFVPSSVDSHFVGATVGLSLGYRYVHLFAELTAGNTWSKAQVFGAERDLGGVTLYPAIGIAFQNSPARPASP